MDPEPYDVIVVGAGGTHGSSTVYHLAKKGLKVLGLESQPVAPHTEGSHGGETRVTRLAYFEGPEYIPILKRSFELWNELEGETGKQVLLKTGCLTVSVDDEKNTWRCFAGALESAKKHGLEHEVLEAEGIRKRFPALSVPDGTRGLFEPVGGVLYPAVSIESHLARARELGAVVELGAKVVSWTGPGLARASARAALGEDDAATAGDAADGAAATAAAAAAEPSPASAASVGDAGAAAPPLAEEPPDLPTPSPPQVSVTLSDGRTFLGRKLVLVPGGWLADLVPELASLLSVQRQVIAWFDVPEASRADFGPERLPVFLLDDAERCLYAFPLDKYGFKIGQMDHLHQDTAPGAVDREVHAEDEELLRDAVRTYAPAAGEGKLNLAATCTFTNTPDRDFLVDFHPVHGDAVVLASACSGHGFKFASVMGSILADLAAEGGTDLDIGIFRFSRKRKGHDAVLDAFAAVAK